LFSGGEGVGCGARAAGLKHLWGIEWEDDIANWARINGFNVITADVTKVNPHDFEPPDVLHASPPCPNFSVAKANGKETDEDVALALATAKFLRALKPKVFTLENVYLYRKSQSWHAIGSALLDLGYKFEYWHLNSADYGVPQTRKRMIVIARKDGEFPERPMPTHGPRGEIAPMFDEREPWVGWYEAIEGLIPTLPDSEFAPWQLERLPDELKTSLFDAKNSRRFFDGEYKPQPITQRQAKEPVWTIQSQVSTSDFRGFIVPDGNASGFGIRKDGMPMRTVGDTKRAGNAPRAFLAEGRAGGNRDLQCRHSHAPSMTVTTSSGGNVYRSVMLGRVVKMTPRALARFQSFTDSYMLPETKTLACKIIGNAVPPLMYQKIIESVK
jgi:DNA (cytosine-5)-methyltransferase 1